MASGTLSERTLHLVRNRPRPLTYTKMSDDLSKHDGTLTANWIALFATERLQTIDCDKIQLIYEYLTGTKLQLV